MFAHCYFSAVLRPGRFDVQVHVFPPDFKGRKEILEHYLSKVTVAPDLNIDPLARATMGCTGADLANIVNQAAIKACLDNATEVTQVHLEFAKDKILMGMPNRSQQLLLSRLYCFNLSVTFQEK